MSALTLSNVAVRYGGRRNSAAVAALEDVTLSIEKGERVAVVGRSGAGKSTIARLACGLVKPSSGTVTALGTDVGAASGSDLRALRRRMHLVFQDPYRSLHPGLTVSQIVHEPLTIAQAATDHSATVADALTNVGLAPHAQFAARRPASLSGGQRQRVAIARALAATPDLILADEPTSMLDASLRATIADMLIGMQTERGATLLFITHDLALARHVADRIVVLADGNVAEDRPTEELLADPHHSETKLLLSAARHSNVETT